MTQMTADEQKQWKEQLARTPSLGAWNGADRGIHDPKKQADEARFIYEKKAKMVFADVAYKVRSVTRAQSIRLAREDSR